jgi:hypothetical protein
MENNKENHHGGLSITKTQALMYEQEHTTNRRRIAMILRFNAMSLERYFIG